MVDLTQLPDMVAPMVRFSSQPAVTRARLGEGFLALAFVILMLMVAWTATAEPRPTVKEARKKFEDLDAKLNRTYKAVQSELSKAQFDKLRVLQRDWIKYRDEMAPDWPRFNGVHTAKAKETAYYWEAMADLTADRIEFLRVYSGKGVPKGISGTYRDFFDGGLTLKETKRGIEFSLLAVRRPSGNIAEIEGVAQRKGDKAIYKEVLTPADKRDDKYRAPCELTFTFIDDHIVKVEGQNTTAYQGLGAYLDGVYFKIQGRVRKQ